MPPFYKLPRRQLRKSIFKKVLISANKLPRRQLRNSNVSGGNLLLDKLPRRQLRKYKRMGKEKLNE